MKTRFTTVSVLVLLLVAFCAETMAQENVVKMNIPSLFMRHLSFQYERALGGKTSVALGVGMQIPRKLPGAALNAGDNNNDTGGTTDAGQLKFNGFTVTPEFRLYTKGEALRGFYIAPFIRIGRYAMKGDFTTTDDAGNVDNFNMKATHTNIGGGLVIGGQWLIADKVAMNLFFGPKIGSINNTATITTTTATFNPDQELEEDLEGFPFVRDVTFETNAIGDELKVGAKGLMPWIRAGFSIGYAF